MKNREKNTIISSKAKCQKKCHKKLLNSLPESNSKFAPEKKPKPKKERIVFQASVFSFYVSFREAKSLTWLMVWDLTPYLPQNAIVTATTRIEIYVFLCEFLLGLPVALSTFTGMGVGVKLENASYKSYFFSIPRRSDRSGTNNNPTI